MNRITHLWARVRSFLGTAPGRLALAAALIALLSFSFTYTTVKSSGRRQVETSNSSQQASKKPVPPTNGLATTQSKVRQTSKQASATPNDLSAATKDMAKQARNIVVGKVTKVKSKWNGDRTQIYTLVSISVDQYIKGKLPRKTITLKQLGGTVGDAVLWVADAPRFTAGEEVLVFIRPGLVPVVGMSNGKLSIDDDSTGRKLIAGTDLALDDLVKEIRDSSQ